MSDRRPCILLVLPGPLFDLEESLRVRLEQISASFQGAVIVFAERAERVRFGAFEVIGLLHEPGRRVGSINVMIDAALETARELARAGNPVQLVTSYDATKTGIVAWRVSKALGAKLVVELNGDVFAPANYTDIENPIRRVLERWLFIALTAFILRRAHGIKTLFEHQFRPLRRFLRRPVIRRFPNFVDLSYFHSLGESNTVLLVGFPLAVKGVDLLIAAFKQVAPSFPSWNLHILGYYPDPSEVNRAIDGHPRISLLPPVPRAKVAAHIGSCGVFALPSRTEAMGRVLMEAAACGKPRLATRVGGIPGVIADEVDGLLVPPENVEALSVALRRLLGDADLRARLGAAAAARAAREFSGPAYVDHLREFYSAVLGAPIPSASPLATVAS